MAIYSPSSGQSEFGGVASNTSGGTATTPPTTITNTADVVPLTITGASGQSADLFDITAFGGAAGGLFKVASDGTLTINASGSPSGASFPADGRVLSNATRADRPAFTLNGSSGAYSGLAGYGFSRSSTNTVDTIVNGFVALQASAVASQVNFFKVAGSATTVAPTIQAQGTDADVSFALLPKGNGLISLQNSAGTACLRVVGTAGTIANGLTVQGAVAATRPSLVATGTDANIDVLVQGKGNTGGVVLQGGAGGSASNSLHLIGVANAANGLDVTPGTTGNPVVLSTNGSDAAVGLTIQTRNASAPVNALTFTAAGGASFVGGLLINNNAMRVGNVAGEFFSSGTLTLNSNSTVALTAGTNTLGFYGVAAVARAGAITAPATQSGAYVQADVQSIVTAVNSIRTALTNIGITS